MEKKIKIMRRVGKGSCDLLLKFWDWLLISGTVEARNVKYSTHIDQMGTEEKMQN